jgi:hypothetical protein
MITKEDGERIRSWNETGEVIDPIEQLQKRASIAAEGGMAEYGAFFQALTAQQKRALAATTHEENKRIAAQVDAGAEDPESDEAIRKQNAKIMSEETVTA